MLNFIVLGAPGAGKGTLSQQLCWQEKYIHVSTGDLLRAEIKAKSELGLRVGAIMQSGGLVPDELVVDLLTAFLGKLGNSKGIVLDGFPRTIRQADLLGEKLALMGEQVTAVLGLEVLDDVLVLRLTGRRVCRTCNRIYHLAYSRPKVEGVCDHCQTPTLYHRPDDNEESVRSRLAVYERETKPLIDYYRQRGLLIPVDAARDKETNMRKLREAIAQWL